ncbi:MAG TPA: hypothetical protein VMY99_03805 [Nevskiaceae bacterium]|nr:hypothetical protein [Nevskiaceae bacterium]
MDDAEQILIIIISSFLGVFLILSIIFLVQMLRLVKTLRHIAQTAEKVIDSAESVGDVFRKAAGPLGFMRIVSAVADTVSRHNQAHKEK